MSTTPAATPTLASEYVNELRRIQASLVAMDDASHAVSIQRLTALIEKAEKPLEPAQTPVQATQEIPESIRFRENFRTRHVELQIDGVKTFSSPEYVTTAKYAQRTYGLSDDKLMDMYRDYKDDYDNPGASDSPPFG